MDNFYKHLSEEIAIFLPRIKELRKELHQFPEIAWNEKETRKRLLHVLKDCTIDIHTPYIETDIVFDMGNIENSDILLLRSDMDALSQVETGNKPHISQNIGAAHNCGHDGHMSMLTGTALIIDQLIKKGYALPRPLRFVYQPAEEIECGGAKLTSLGILKDVNQVMAIHGWPGLKKGEIFSKEGPFFAAAATFITIIEGKATHGGLPENGLSPFPAASLMINEINKIQDDYKDKAIVSSCIINGGSSDNIIPGSIEIRGTIRYYDQSHFNEIKERFIQSAIKVKEQTLCGVKTDYISKYYIPVSNDGSFISSLSSALEKESHELNDIPSKIYETTAKTVSEDFAFYTDKKPGALLLLGLGDETPTLHASDFDFPDEVLIKGILLFITAAYNLI